MQLEQRRDARVVAAEAAWFEAAAGAMTRRADAGRARTATLRPRARRGRRRRARTSRRCALRPRASSACGRRCGRPTRSSPTAISSYPASASRRFAALRAAVMPRYRAAAAAPNTTFNLDTSAIRTSPRSPPGRAAARRGEGARAPRGTSGRADDGRGAAQRDASPGCRSRMEGPVDRARLRRTGRRRASRARQSRRHCLLDEER